jgi:hypothetical protein
MNVTSSIITLNVLMSLLHLHHFFPFFFIWKWWILNNRRKIEVLNFLILIECTNLQGIVIFASVMATLGLQILFESTRQLITKVYIYIHTHTIDFSFLQALVDSKTDFHCYVIFVIWQSYNSLLNNITHYIILSHEFPNVFN